MSSLLRLPPLMPGNREVVTLVEGLRRLLGIAPEQVFVRQHEDEPVSRFQSSEELTLASVGVVPEVGVQEVLAAVHTAPGGGGPTLHYQMGVHEQAGGQQQADGKQQATLEAQSSPTAQASPNLQNMKDAAETAVGAAKNVPVAQADISSQGGGIGLYEDAPGTLIPGVHRLDVQIAPGQSLVRAGYPAGDTAPFTGHPLVGRYGDSAEAAAPTPPSTPPGGGGNVTPHVLTLAAGTAGSVYERALPTGTAPLSAECVISTSMGITASLGCSEVSIDGVVVISGGMLAGPGVVHTAYGDLVITGYDVAGGRLACTFTLDAPASHAPGSGCNDLLLRLPVQVTDTSGATVHGSLDIGIVDDVPVARDDAASIDEDTPAHAGNVLYGVTPDTGADGPHVVVEAGYGGATGRVDAAGSTFAGTHGTLLLHVDGSYLYQLDTTASQHLVAGEQVTDTFTYSMRDADGDVSSATLVITVNGVDDGVLISGLTPASSGGEGLLLEANLPQGSSSLGGAPVQFQGAFSVSAPDGLDRIFIEGALVIQGGAIRKDTVVIPCGYLHVDAYDAATGTVTYTFVLDAPLVHDVVQGNNLGVIELDVVAHDRDGSQQREVLSVVVVDDVPEAMPVDASGLAGTAIAASGTTIAGKCSITSADKLTSMIFSANNETATSVKSNRGEDVTFDISPGGELITGYVGLKASGIKAFEVHLDVVTGNWAFTQYKYLSIADDRLDFRYTVTDADGDSDEATLSIKVAEAPSGGATASLALDDTKAIDAAVDTKSALLDFTPGSIALGASSYSFDISSAPTVSGYRGVLGWSLEGGSLVAKNSAGAKVLELSLRNGTGTGVEVVATLLDPVDHGDITGVSPVVISNVTVVASDGVTPPATGMVDVSISDLKLRARADWWAIDAKPVTTSIVIMLDSSLSMGTASSVAGYANRLDLAKETINRILAGYDTAGSINVKIIDFGSWAQSSDWLKGTTAVDAAKSWIAGNVKLQGASANFDYALHYATEMLLDGLPAADRSVGYFLSAGVPDSANGYGLSAYAEAQWAAFIKSTSIDTFYAYGMGNLSAAALDQLKCVAVDRDGNAATDPAKQLTNFNQIDMLGPSPVVVTGNVLANDWSPVSGLRLASVTVNGVTVLFENILNPDHKHLFTLGDGRGTLSIDYDDGSYVYTTGNAPFGSETVRYVVTDAYGTQRASTLDMSFMSPALEAYDNQAIVAISTKMQDVTMHLLSGENYNEIMPNYSGHVEYAGATSEYVYLGCITAGTVVSFSIDVVPTHATSGLHDDDKVAVWLEQQNETDGTWGAVSAGGLWVVSSTGQPAFIYREIGTMVAGFSRLHFQLVDGDPSIYNEGSKYGGLDVSITDVRLSEGFAPVSGNVITDHAGGERHDLMGGCNVSVDWVNGSSMHDKGVYSTIKGLYGTLSINNNGQYFYNPDGTHSGYDDTFVYRISNGISHDYATLDVHIGDANLHYIDSNTVRYGDDSNEAFIGGTGKDILNGNGGDDILFGNKNDDTLNGDAGNDSLYGGAGNDILNGSSGNDILVGGKGSDLLNGGDGADTFIFKNEDITSGARDWIHDFSIRDGDVLRLGDVVIGESYSIGVGGVGVDSQSALLVIKSTQGARQEIVLESLLVEYAGNAMAMMNDLNAHISFHKILNDNS